MKTIVAISSAIGTGGIGIVRMSGDDVLRIAKNVFEFKKSNINLEVYPMQMHFGTLGIGIEMHDDFHTIPS